MRSVTAHPASKLKRMKLTLDLRKLERVRRDLGARSRSEAVRMVVDRELAILKEMRAERSLRKNTGALNLGKLYETLKPK